MFYTKTKSLRSAEGLRGFEQIRTAVKGFADLCLATRPRNHYQAAKIKQTLQASKQIITRK